MLRRTGGPQRALTISCRKMWLSASEGLEAFTSKEKQHDVSNGLEIPFVQTLDCLPAHSGPSMEMLFLSGQMRYAMSAAHASPLKRLACRCCPVVWQPSAAAAPLNVQAHESIRGHQTRTRMAEPHCSRLYYKGAPSLLLVLVLLFLLLHVGDVTGVVLVRPVSGMPSMVPFHMLQIKALAIPQLCCKGGADVGSSPLQNPRRQ